MEIQVVRGVLSGSLDRDQPVLSLVVVLCCHLACITAVVFLKPSFFQQAWLSTFLTKDRRELGYSEEMQSARHVHFIVS